MLAISDWLQLLVIPIGAGLFGIVWKHMRSDELQHAALNEAITENRMVTMAESVKMLSVVTANQAASSTETSRIRLELAEYRVTAIERFASTAQLHESEQRIVKQLDSIESKVVPDVGAIAKVLEVAANNAKTVLADAAKDAAVVLAKAASTKGD